MMYKKLLNARKKKSSHDVLMFLWSGAWRAWSRVLHKTAWSSAQSTVTTRNGPSGPIVAPPAGLLLVRNGVYVLLNKLTLDWRKIYPLSVVFENSKSLFFLRRLILLLYFCSKKKKKKPRDFLHAFISLLYALLVKGGNTRGLDVLKRWCITSLCLKTRLRKH